ncbi:MAG: DUF1841 family protein, partial [Gammaproteobacteria bacterium]|nr:DUF1841 family protein [Gammaproteobacteria bacterium]
GNGFSRLFVGFLNDVGVAMFDLNRDQLRGFYVAAWKKHLAAQPLEPLEAQVVEIILLHPEYHALLASGADAVARDYTAAFGEQNPFLHMGLHLALREQLAMDRPPGLRALYQAVAVRVGDEHSAAHRIHACLAEALWQAQRQQTLPDEQAYLTCVRGLANLKQ